MTFAQNPESEGRTLEARGLAGVCSKGTDPLSFGSALHTCPGSRARGAFPVPSLSASPAPISPIVWTAYLLNTYPLLRLSCFMFTCLLFLVSSLECKLSGRGGGWLVPEA